MLLFIPRWDYNGYTVDDHKESFEVYEDDKKIIYRRNKEIEIQTLQFLQEAHPKFKGQNNFYLSFEEASKKNWFFNFYHEKLKDGFSVVGMDMLGYFRYSPHPIETEFHILKTDDNDDNNVTAILKTYFGKEKVSIKTLQKALNEGKKYVLLKDSSLGILTDQWLEQYGLILKYATADQDTIIFSKWILIVSEAKSEHQEHLRMVLTEDWLHKWQTWQQSNDILYPVPQNLKATLRNYQQKGYEWINLMAEVNAGTLLADDMGLGKTLQTIASVVYWQEQNPGQKVLVVCPASLVYNWKIEFEKFAPSLKLAIYHNATRNFMAFIEGEETVLISSYSIVRNDIDQFKRMLWDAVVLDESHHIKNHKTKQTQAILSLLAKKRIILNGTPIMNNVSDLFPQLHFLLPQLFNSRKKFQDEFENPIHQTLAQNPMEQLRKLTNPFVLRRTKEIVAPDLPKKTESIFWCEMSDDQRSVYETLKAQIKQNIFMEIDHKGLNKAKLGVLQGITKLRQVCSSPRLLKDFDGVQKAASIKIDQLIESLTTNLKNEKVIVFTQFLGTMELISKQLTKKGIEYLSFSGSTLAEKRMELVSEFQDKNSSARVFLLSLMAGNSGINLTRANYVFLVEPWWNKAVQQQAIDRVHRIGQDRHVFAYTMICKDTIEEKIIALQDKKQFISDEIIANEENFVKNLNEEDIAFLFE
jgi:SNF2 family DNA or RNA helicase